MTRSAEGGFTLIEVLVAVVVLAIGVIALAGSSGQVTRMIGRGKMTTIAAQVAQDQMDRLRVAAASTNPRCTAASFTSAAAAELRPVGRPRGEQVLLNWSVPASGASRTVRMSVTYNVVGGTVTDSLYTRISC